MTDEDSYEQYACNVISNPNFRFKAEQRRQKDGDWFKMGWFYVNNAQVTVITKEDNQNEITSCYHEHLIDVELWTMVPKEEGDTPEAFEERRREIHRTIHRQKCVENRGLYFGGFKKRFKRLLLKKVGVFYRSVRDPFNI